MLKRKGIEKRNNMVFSQTLRSRDVAQTLNRSSKAEFKNDLHSLDIFVFSGMVLCGYRMRYLRSKRN